MSSAEDRIVGLLRKLLVAKSGTADSSRCPGEEVLSQFLAGKLSPDARSNIEGHLADCSRCAETVVAAYKADQPRETARAPQWLTARAKALVQPKESLLDLSVRIIRGSLELITTSGRVVPFFHPVVRGQAKPVEDNALQVEQKLGRFKVAVEIDVSNQETCQLTANVSGEDGKPADGVRLTLNSDGREQASFVTRAGMVVFDRISPGECSITVSESDNLVGKIRLNLMLER